MADLRIVQEQAKPQCLQDGRCEALDTYVVDNELHLGGFEALQQRCLEYNSAWNTVGKCVIADSLQTVAAPKNPGGQNA